MSPFRSRLKSPEEVELDRKRSELAHLQERLAERERFFSSFKAEIRMFEQLYEEMLGTRIAQLEDLEWQLEGLLGVNRSAAVSQEPSDEGETFTHFKHYTDLLDEDEEGSPEPDALRQSLKHLYREVAKAIHPDLASDDEERLRRQELMAMANQAYESGDRSALEDLLGDRDLGPEPGGVPDVAMELVRVIRQIARIQQNIHAVNRQIEELRATDIHIFKLRVDEALADGLDLLAEMAAAVDLNVAKARKRLAALRGDADQDDDPHTLLETRLIRFPKDRSHGTLYERDAGSVDYRDWRRLGSAKGVREVRLGREVRLDAKGSGKADLEFLDALLPDDLQALFLHEIDDSALARLVHLSGLQELYLSNTAVTDKGMKHLVKLTGLVRLNIYHTAISDTGLRNLTKLKGLKWLTCSGTGITEEGLERFRKALPGCKAVNFKWRFEKQEGRVKGEG